MTLLRRACFLCTFYFLSQTCAASTDFDLRQLYLESPVEAHARLRQLYTAGEPQTAAIHELQKLSGDFSFESLGASSESVRAGLYLQIEALELWNRGAYAQAIDIYRQALELFSSEGALSEAAFCHYYIAEVLAEQEKFEESLLWSERGLALSTDHDFLYLASLLLESRAYSLWYLDRLPSSVRSFAAALKFWEGTRSNHGALIHWSNLALLYSDLGLPSRAQKCYLQALALLETSSPAEIRFRVLLNYAKFLQAEGDLERSRRFLELSRPYADVAPDEFALADAHIHDRIQETLEIEPRIPSDQIERLLHLAAWHEREKRPQEAERCFRAALQISSETKLFFMERMVLIDYGSFLERQKAYSKAIHLYRQGLEGEPLLHKPDPKIPFAEAVSPFFDGWIRCLVQEGDPAKARSLIRRITRLRRTRVAKLLEDDSREKTPTSVAEGPIRRPDEQESGTLYSTLEFWPDEDRIFVWLEGPRSQFFNLELSRSGLELLRTIADPLYNASDSLPPPSQTVALQQFSKQVIAPLEMAGLTSKLLLIPHKQLQLLPFEMLHSRSGRVLAEEYVISYLPDPVMSLVPEMEASPERPLLLLPDSFSARSGAQAEVRFFRFFMPRARIRRQFPGSSLKGRVIHLSTHLKADRESILEAGIATDRGSVSPLKLMERSFDCRVLSLAVCSGADGRSAPGQFWLGLSELLLLRGARSVVVSRWALDEKSVQIYLDFYRYALRGFPTDEALALARRDFMSQGLAQHLELPHPLFWAGIIYVGRPNARIFAQPIIPGSSFWLPLVLALALLGSSLWAVLGRTPSSRIVLSAGEESNPPQ